MFALQLKQRRVGLVAAHSRHATAWPHGEKITSTGASMHTAHCGPSARAAAAAVGGAVGRGGEGGLHAAGRAAWAAATSGSSRRRRGR